MTIESMRKAVELHRPVMYDKYAHPTDKPEEMAHRRCEQCHMSVPADGCPTWRVANS